MSLMDGSAWEAKHGHDVKFQMDISEHVKRITDQVDREAFRQLLLEELRKPDSPVTLAVAQIAHSGYCL